MSLFLNNIFSNRFTRVLLSVFSGLVILALYYTFISYRFQINAFKEIETSKLKSIANTLSKSVNAEDISTFFKSSHGHNVSTGENELFLKYFHLFRDVKRENKLNSDIITLKYDSLNHYFLNGFSSSYKKDYSDNIIMPELLEKNYTTGGFIDEFENEMGYWVIAFAPIKDKNGNTVSIVLIKDNFSYFIQKAKKKTIQNITLSLILFLVVGFFLFRIIQKFLIQEERRESELLSSHQIIEEKNRLITSSIKYAERIQSAILPPLELIKENFEDSFVFYKPKDIVSGDFYWQGVKNDKVYLVAADCTGHGVPGAFMSMICNSLIIEAVFELDEDQPSKILDSLENLLKQRVKDTKEFNEGMDLAICCFDLNNMQLEYAGAYRPLYLIKNNVLEIIPSDRSSIGSEKSSSFKQYTNHIVPLEKGNCIYISSDGYADQFGGQENKKFSTKAFKGLLEHISEYPMQRQREILEQTFMDWKKELVQVDDILVMGVRI